MTDVQCFIRAAGCIGEALGDGGDTDCIADTFRHTAHDAYLIERARTHGIDDHHYFSILLRGVNGAGIPLDFEDVRKIARDTIEGWIIIKKKKGIGKAM